MRRRFAATLALVVVLGFSGSSAWADTTLSLGSAEALPGDEIEIPIVLDTTTSIAALQLQVKHDPALLILEEIVEGADLPSGFIILPSVEPTLGGSMGAVALLGIPVTGEDLEIAVLRYTVRCDAEPGDTSIEFTDELDPLVEILVETSAGVLFAPEVEHGTVTILAPPRPIACDLPPVPIPECLIGPTGSIDGSAIAPDADFGSSVAVDGHRMIVRASIDPEQEHAAYTFSMDADTGEWVLEGGLSVSDTSFENHGPSRVDISGDRAVVGAVGAAFVFSYEAGTGWVEEDKFLSTPDSQFGLRVAISGDVLVITSAGADYVSVFERDPATGAWKDVATLESEGPAANFGEAVAISGAIPEARIVVGSLSNSVQLFVRDATTGEWSFEQRIDGPSGFGRSVAIESTRLVVGAPETDDEAGAIHLYEFDEGTGEWFHVIKLTASDVTADDLLGHGVALLGDRIAANATGQGFGLSTGAVYTFAPDPDTGEWTEEAKLVTDPHGHARTGGAIALVDNYLLAGLSPENRVQIFDIDCSEPPPPEFVRGDADGNGATVALNDAIYLLQWQFVEGAAPPCLDAADADDNGRVIALQEAIYLLRWGFMSGPVPPTPGVDDCGPDPTADDTDCATPPRCP